MSLFIKAVLAKNRVNYFLKKNHKNSVVIYNGTRLTSSEKKSHALPSIQLVTTGYFRRRDQIEPLIHAFKKLPANFELTIYGSFASNLSSLFKSFKNIPHLHIKEKIPHQLLLSELPLYNVFIFSDQSACPNAVLEALGAALPVVAFDRGSISELVESGSDGEVVSLAPHNPWSKPYIFTEKDYIAFAEAVQKVINNPQLYQQVTQRFSIETMMNHYLKVLALTSHG